MIYNIETYVYDKLQHNKGIKQDEFSSFLMAFEQGAVG